MPKCKLSNPRYPDKVDLMADTSADGNPAEVFTLSISRMPANILTVGGGETYRGQQLEAHISHVVETPYRPNVTAEKRLFVRGGIYDARTLNIELSKPIRKTGAQPVLVLHCRELET